MIDKLSSKIIRLEDGPEKRSLLCLPDCSQDSEGMPRKKNLELQAREALLCYNQSLRGLCDTDDQTTNRTAAMNTRITRLHREPYGNWSAVHKSQWGWTGKERQKLFGIRKFNTESHPGCATIAAHCPLPDLCRVSKTERRGKYTVWREKESEFQVAYKAKGRSEGRRSEGLNVWKKLELFYFNKKRFMHVARVPA